MHHLFAALAPEYRQRLETLPTALDTVAPMRTAHRRDLPTAIRELSQMLTSERGALSEPYWAAPRLLSAYLRYFMPWNLVRLGRLLPSLDLVDREALLENPLIVDLGSGPLTLPLALWLARPDLRTLPLTFLCADIAPHPLEVGRDLLQVVAGEESPWALRTLRGPLEVALKEARGNASLVMAGNVMNELKPRRDEPLEFRMEELAALAGTALAPGGRLLVIEPGTRLGARYVTQFRRAALETGLAPLAPCTHHEECPMLEQGGAGGWCHFTFPIQGAPAWLDDLSRRAKLEKGTASLSFVLLGEAGRVVPPRNTIRIISDAFPLPGRREPARYACSERGLALLHDARQVHSGTALDIVWPEEERRDRKSGALELEWTPPGRGGDRDGSTTDGRPPAAGTRARGARRSFGGQTPGTAYDPAQPDGMQPSVAHGHDGEAAAHRPDDRDPSEPDGNRADGPDHGATYGQMFANDQPFGKSAQRRGAFRTGVRRPQGRNAGQHGAFTHDFAFSHDMSGSQPDNFGNRADSGRPRKGRTGDRPGDRAGDRPGDRPGGRQAGQHDGNRRTARRAAQFPNPAPQRAQHPRDEDAQPQDTAGNRMPGHGQGRDGQRRAQRPQGQGHRQHPADRQEGRAEGRQHRRHDQPERQARQDAPQRDQQERGEGQTERSHRRQLPGKNRHGQRQWQGGQPDAARQHPGERAPADAPRNRQGQPERQGQPDRAERRDARPSRPGERRDGRRDDRRDERRDRPRDDRPRTGREHGRDGRGDAPRADNRQPQGTGNDVKSGDAARRGKPQRHLDRDGKPGGERQQRDGRQQGRGDARQPDQNRQRENRHGGRPDARPDARPDTRPDARPDARRDNDRPNNAQDTRQPGNEGRGRSRRRRPRRTDGDA